MSTANVLRELTEERMNQVMFFLKSLNLTGNLTEKENQTISLFKNINLQNAELSKIESIRNRLQETVSD